MVRLDYLNELIESKRDSNNLYVVFSQRGQGKNAVTKLIQAVNFIELIYKTELKIYYDKKLINKCCIVLEGYINNTKIDLVIDHNAFNMPLNEFVYRVAHKFTQVVEDELFMQRIKRKGK